MMSTRKGWQKEQAALAKRIRASQRGAGFTLLEILVALAIFVIGAVAIIRIFPPALGAIQGSENRTIATNTSRDLLARLASNPALVPDSIYHPSNYVLPADLDPNDDFDTPAFDGAVSGTTLRNRSLPETIREADFENSALGNVKRIVGERHPVLRRSASGPLYALTEYSHSAGSGNNNTLVVFVEDTVTGVKIDNQGRLDFSDARLQTLNVPFNERDYDRAGRTPLSTPPVPPVAPDGAFVHEARLAPSDWRGPETVYYVSYQWTVGGRVQGVIDEPLVMEDGVLDQTERPRVLLGRSPGPALNTINPGEVSIRVKRAIRTFDEADTPNGYESDLPVPSPGDNDRRGFSVRGYVPVTDDDTTTNNQIPSDLKSSATDEDLEYANVSINYTVRDWRWMINNDSPAPAGTIGTDDVGTITLPLRNFDNEHLLDALTIDGDYDATVYSLVTSSNTSVIPTITDFTFGKWDGEGDVTNDGNILTDAASDSADRYGVNSRKGIVRYNIDGLSSPKARTAYWTLDGWAQQLSVAARSYVPFIDGAGYPSSWRAAAEREEWREYYWNGTNNTLYFAPTEAGKTVQVTFEATDGTTHKVKTAVYTINEEDLARPAGVPGTFEGITGRVCDMEIEVFGDAFDDVTAILAVKGLSVQARTAWIEGQRYQQASASGYRPIDQS